MPDVGRRVPSQPGPAVRPAEPGVAAGPGG